MTRKRTNFKAMNQKDFIAYLNQNKIPYNKFKTTTLLGLSVIKIKTDHSRLLDRVFNGKTGIQLDSKIKLTEIDITTKVSNQLSLKRLIKIIDDRIQQMGTKDIYHPKRLKPKWNSLTDDAEKIALFEKHVTTKESSIGFLKLVNVNLCHKTLEAIIIEYPKAISFLSNNEARIICINKFSKYNYGKQYLLEKGVDLLDETA